MNPYFVKLSNGNFINLSQVCSVSRLQGGIYIVYTHAKTLDPPLSTSDEDALKILAALDKLASIVSEPASASFGPPEGPTLRLMEKAPRDGRWIVAFKEDSGNPLNPQRGRSMDCCTIRWNLEDEIWEPYSGAAPQEYVGWMPFWEAVEF